MGTELAQSHDEQEWNVSSLLTPETVAILDKLDPGMVLHSFDDLLLFKKFLDVLGLDYSDAMLCGALLHDVGKIGLDYLFNNHDLTNDELKVVKTHVVRSLYLLDNLIDKGKVDINIPLLHHQHMDGSGYPFGLRGEAIPLYIRAFSIVDAFSAATSDHAHKKASTPHKAILNIERQVGTWYDPSLFAVFSSQRNIWENHVEERERAYEIYKYMPRLQHV